MAIPRVKLTPNQYKKIKNAALLAGAGGQVGGIVGYGAGGNDGKVPLLVKGKLKRGQKKAPTVQRAAAIAGLATGAGIGLLRK